MFDDDSLVDVSSEPGLSYGIELIADGKVRQYVRMIRKKQLPGRGRKNRGGQTAAHTRLQQYRPAHKRLTHKRKLSLRFLKHGGSVASATLNPVCTQLQTRHPASHIFVAVSFLSHMPYGMALQVTHLGAKDEAERAEWIEDIRSTILQVTPRWLPYIQQ